MYPVASNSFRSGLSYRYVCCTLALLSSKIRPSLSSSRLIRSRPRSIWTGLHSDTIYGPATPLGIRSALAILRVDGPQADSLCQSITRPIHSKYHLPSQLPQHRRAALRKIVCPLSHHVLDPEAIVLRFEHPARSSSTIEFHLHGSPAVLKSVLNTFSKLKHLRPAQPGEFTRRKLERAQGAMDINKILGLKHLIDAETEEQRRWAVAEFDSKFNQVYQLMRQQLTKSMALCEVIIDFSEDGSMDDAAIWKQVRNQVQELKTSISNQLSSSLRREKISMGIRVSLYGSPNVGKSSFLNYLVNREAAIVSPYPGTTRDVIEVSLDYHGFPILLSDTAGLRTSEDPVEKIGIERAKENIKRADVRIYVTSATDDVSFECERSILDPVILEYQPTMVLVTKTDLIEDSSYRISELTKKIRYQLGDLPVYPVNIVKEGNPGISEFIEAFRIHLSRLYGFDSTEKQKTTHTFYLTNYQKIQLGKILEHLDNFLTLSNFESDRSQNDNTHQDAEELKNDDQVDVVILIEELRIASGLLSKLSFCNPSSLQLDQHEISTEEILGEIFQSFCIGK